MGGVSMGNWPEGAVREVVNVDIEGIPPTINHMYAPRKGGGRMLTDEARAWRERVAYQINPYHYDVMITPDTRFSLRIGVWWPDARHRDLDNVLKILQDTLAWVFGFNDRNVWELHIVRLGVDRKDPRVEVHLWEIAPDGGT